MRLAAALIPLARLRRLLGDELFLRTSSDMAAVPFAEPLPEPVAIALGLLHSAVNLRAAMEAGQVDLALGLLPQLNGGFFERKLFSQRHVCLLRHSHRPDKRAITLKEFPSAEHVVVMSAGTVHGKVDELLERIVVARTFRLRLPHFVAVGHILAGSDMIATVPQRFADTVCARFGLVSVRHPATIPDIAISLFWHAKAHRDPANRWLRERILALHAVAAD